MTLAQARTVMAMYGGDDIDAAQAKLARAYSRHGAAQNALVDAETDMANAEAELIALAEEIIDETHASLTDGEAQTINDSHSYARNAHTSVGGEGE